jgi:glycosyltransferase involved in cell wall biosynthesis
VKDPFRAARAARKLPASSRIRILHAGAALDARTATAARIEEARNPRYRWLGDLPHGRALRLLARSRLLVLTSRLEGGANVLTEALACKVPVVASRIDGSLGILGSEYAGYFSVGDTRGLAALLHRVETDARFYGRLVRTCRQLARLVDPKLERQSWERLLLELTQGPPSRRSGGRRSARGRMRAPRRVDAHRRARPFEDARLG